MNRVLMASLIIVGICFAAYGQEHSRPTPTPFPRSTPISNPDGWVNFNSAPGRFSVLMPATPTEKTETVQSEPGPYTTHLFVVKGAKSVFLIGWVDYDPGFNLNPIRELDMNRENFIKGVNATLVNNRSVKIDGYDSIEFTAETGETVFKSRVYMVGRRPYQLVAGTAKGLDDSSNVNRFFDSFKVRSR
jgi:hypothetical protein